MKVIFPNDFANRLGAFQNKVNIYFSQKPASFIRRIYLNVIGDLNIRGFHFIGEWDNEEQARVYYENRFSMITPNIFDKLSFFTSNIFY